MAAHFHIVPRDGRWAVKREGQDEVSSVRDDQDAAIAAAHDLAEEGDILIVHRADGAIQENITHNAATAAARNRKRRSNVADDDVSPSYVLSVGSRVSWAAIFAGVAVAAALSFLLNLITVAIGLTLFPENERGFAVFSLIMAMISLIVSAFLGGFIASRTTAGETGAEAAIYGVLVWATGLLLLAATGTGLGAGVLAGTHDQGRSELMSLQSVAAAADLDESSGASAEGGGGSGRSDVSPATRAMVEAWDGATNLAWATVVGTGLSLLAAITGAYLGAGPHLTFEGDPSRRNLVAEKS